MSHTYAEFTFDASIVSDLHKEAYGCRPSSFWWECWGDASDDDRQAEWDDLLATAERRALREALEEKADLEEFEQELAAIKSTGKCKSDIDALQWMTPIEFEDNSNLTMQDVEFWVWNRGILFTDRGREIVKMICEIHGVK